MDMSGPPNDMPMDNQQKSMMWQQSQYMGDSGIHSSATTRTPSISSKHGPDEMDTEENMDTSCIMFDFDQGFNQGYTQEQVDEMNQQLV